MSFQYAVHIGPADEHLVCIFTPNGPWAWDVVQVNVSCFALWAQAALSDDRIKQLPIFWQGCLEGRDAKDQWVAKYKAWPLHWR